MTSISRLPRGLSTCCLRFMGDVATAHARLASGWLARLCREGVEPSGSQRKVSEFYISFPFPGFILTLTVLDPGCVNNSNRAFTDGNRILPDTSTCDCRRKSGLCHSQFGGGRSMRSRRAGVFARPRPTTDMRARLTEAREVATPNARGRST